MHSERLVMDFMRYVDDSGKITQTIEDIEISTGVCHDWPSYTVSIIATTDEHTLGRLACVQRGRAAQGRQLIFVTVADSRLTSSGLADIASSIWRTIKMSPDRAFGMLDVCRNAIYKIVASWALDGDICARDPDLVSLARGHTGDLFASPGRVPGSVSICGGRAVIATIDRATSERISRCQRMIDSRPGVEWPTLFDKNAPLRAALAEHATDGEDTHVYLVDQTNGTGFEVFEKMHYGAFVGQLIRGVPAYHVCAMALSLAMDPLDVNINEFVLSLPEQRAESTLRHQRADASRTIRTILSGDKAVRAIKELVWRPDGRLVGRRVDAAVSRKRPRAE